MATQPTPTPRKKPTKQEPVVENGVHVVDMDNLGQNMWIKVKDLLVDPRYQRDLRPRHLDRIVKKFNPALLRTFDVHRIPDSKGTWKFYVYDGQHRLRACQIKGLDEAAVPCNVKDLSSAEAAALFRSLNRDRAALTAYDDYRAGVYAKDPEMLEIERIVTVAGMVVQSTNAGSRPSGIMSIATTIAIMRETDPLVLEDVLRAIAHAWPEQDGGTTQSILRGVALFYATHHQELEPGYLGLVKALKDTTPQELLTEAKSHKRHRQWSLAAFVAWCLAMGYNRRYKRHQITEYPVGKYSQAFKTYRDANNA